MRRERRRNGEKVRKRRRRDVGESRKIRGREEGPGEGGRREGELWDRIDGR